MRERGDEMSPSLRALVGVTRFWLALGFVGGIFGALVVAVIASFYLYKLLPGGNIAVPFIACGLTFGSLFLVVRGRRIVARAISRRIERKLGAISGSSSTAALPAGFTEHDVKRGPR